MEIPHQMPMAATAISVTPRKIAGDRAAPLIGDIGAADRRNLCRPSGRLVDRRTERAEIRRIGERTARAPAGRAPRRRPGAPAAQGVRGGRDGNVERRFGARMAGGCVVSAGRGDSRSAGRRAGAIELDGGRLFDCGFAGSTDGGCVGGPRTATAGGAATGCAGATAGMNSVSISAIFACRSLRRFAAVSGARSGLPCSARSSAANADR